MEERKSRKKRITDHGLLNAVKFAFGFPGRDGLQKKSRVARWRQHPFSQMGPTKTEAGTSRKAVAKEPNDRDRNAHRR